MYIYSTRKRKLIGATNKRVFYTKARTKTKVSKQLFIRNSVSSSFIKTIGTVLTKITHTKLFRTLKLEALFTTIERVVKLLS